MAPQNELQKNVGDQNPTFNVGSFVWAKTRSRTWWPGMISDPSKTKKPSKSIKKMPCLLVNFFGNAGCVWCKMSDLKPFIHHFDEFSGQIDSGKFYGSVEKALFLYGQRVKANMTCRCFMKKVAANSDKGMSMRIKVDAFLPSQFDPRVFLSCIQDMGRSDRVCGKVELTTIMNCLSAFYCSVGHRDLPLHVILKPDGRGRKGISRTPENSTRIKRKRDNDTADSVVDTAVASNGKRSESRERKKSKYLSYPYVDAKRDSSTAAPEALKLNSICSRNLGKRGDNGAIKVDYMVSKPDHINPSASELLTELCSGALNCADPNGSKISDSLKRYYIDFRKFSCLNVDIACNSSVSSKEDQETKENETRKMDVAKAKDDKNVAVANESADVEIPLVKESENGSVKAASGKDGGSDAMTKEFPEMRNFLAMGRLTDVRASFPSTLSSVTADQKSNSNAVNFQYDSPDTFGIKASSHGGVSLQTNTMAHFPGMNENIPQCSVENPPFKTTAISFDEILPKQSNMASTDHGKNGVTRISFGSITSLKDAQLALQSPEPGNANTRVGKAGFGSSFSQKLPMALYASVVEPKYRKQKQKEKTCEAISGIPDLNGNASDKCFRGKTPSDHNYACKQESKAGLNTGESIGGILILTFSPGCTLPPKETLVKTFSRFGLLNESKIEVLDESTIHIPYQRSSEASFAFRSLEKNKPFGSALATFKLDCPAAVTRPMKRTVSPLVNDIRTPVKAREAPDVAFMKQNVEMMKSTLEKAGASLSPVMRAKLENEIKVFLCKIDSLAGSGTS